MVTKRPPASLMGSKEEQERLMNLPAEVEEEEALQSHRNGRVASSIDDLLVPAGCVIRYVTAHIVGLLKPVRFKSLTTKQFLEVSEEDDRNLLLYSVCDDEGHAYLTVQDLDRLQGEESDARTYMHMLAVANDHCLAGATLEGLAEAAAKNLPAAG